MIQRSQDMGIPMDELEERRNALIPIGRANEPEDIADMAAFSGQAPVHATLRARHSTWTAAW